MSIDHAAVSAFHHSLRETPAAANQAVEVLFRIYRAAEDRETIPEGSNPCRQIALNRPRRHERFLTDEEFQRLGRALDEAEEKGGARMYTAMAVRLLLLTGCRKNEIVNLHWDHVDPEAGEMRLPDAKTGAKTIPLNGPALGVLAAAKRVEGNPYVVVGTAEGAHLTDLQKPWRRVRKAAGLDDVRIHDLRHTFASEAVMGGESLPMVGRILGHTQAQTTARYAHLADDPLQRASERIASSLKQAMDG